MEALRKLLRKIVARMRGDDLKKKRRLRSFKQTTVQPEDVQMIRWRRNNQGTIIPITPEKQSLNEESSVALRSSEELDERLNTFRAKRRQERVNLNDYVYVGSLLHVSISQRASGCGDSRLPPLSAHFAASNISTFIERLTFSHAAASGADHSTPIWLADERDSALSLPPLPPLSFIYHDDLDDYGTGNLFRGEVANRLSLS